MLQLILCLCLLSDGSSLPFQTQEAPQGLRLTDVIVAEQGSSTKVTVKGRFSGFDKGRVWFDLTLKRGTVVVGTDRDYLDVIPNQNFTRTFHMKTSEAPEGTRAFFKFGELQPR